MSISSSNMILKKLGLLSRKSVSSTKIVVQELLELAFKCEKPLFDSTEKQKAGPLVEKSIPLFDKAFTEIHGSLNLDLRQNAQICRSGLQFIVDEFKDDTILYPKLQELLMSDPVQCVEEYIADSKDDEPEYGLNVKISPDKIPKDHSWWY